MKSTHSGRLERYLGTEKVQELSDNMRGWYGPPIALNGVPGQVYATGDGDFIGECRLGWELSMFDHAMDLVRRLKRAAKVASGNERNRLNAGFTSISDIVAGATGGNVQYARYNKTTINGVANASSSLWAANSSPQAGAAASAAPGGRVCTSSTTGAISFINATGGNTLHIVSSSGYSTVNSFALLLYDRIFDVAKTMSSSTAEAVTGVPTRYQSTTPGADDYAGGNFIFPEIFTGLPATVHNWTTCTYTNQDGTPATLPAINGTTSGSAGKHDQGGTHLWFAPLADGDTGIQTLTQMQCDVNTITGAVNFVIGHPLAWMVHPVAGRISMFDYIHSSFMLPRVFDDACLALLEPNRATSTAASFDGQITLVSG